MLSSIVWARPRPPAAALAAELSRMASHFSIAPLRSPAALAVHSSRARAHRGAALLAAPRIGAQRRRDAVRRRSRAAGGRRDALRAAR